MKRIFPRSFYNPISVFGAALASVAFATIVFLTFVELFQQNAPAYIGIVSYVILPAFLFAGFAVMFFGAWRERRRLRKGKTASKMSFVIDLNLPRQRTLLTFFSTASIILLLFTAYGSYRTFEWTESVEFCGETCHDVMEPEYTAYQHSPHARVKCVECHVGSGAGWYMRSKLSGAYQVYAVTVNNYPKPIPTPIANLRPAQETCEQCHWPSHFSGEKKVVNTYFKSDEQNTRWTVALLMKTGGGSSDRGPTSGIHWHMNIANEIQFVATDSQSQTIPYIRARNKATGEEVEYISSETTTPIETFKTQASHKMDCIDCHNRPSHVYRPPVRIVDQSMALGKISPEIPNIRYASVEALTKPYATAEGATDSIPLYLKEYYQKEYPGVITEKSELLAKASEELNRQYKTNFFPKMNVNWKAYPNNIGHMTNVGCFRCHDGKHVSPQTGKTITKDCNSCHTILYQGTEKTATTMNVSGLEFQHPEDIGDAWKEMNCVDCHAN